MTDDTLQSALERLTDAALLVTRITPDGEPLPASQEAWHDLDSAIEQARTVLAASATDEGYHEHIAGDRHSHPFNGPHSHGGVSALAASAPDEGQPRIVCICGSTRFAEHMNTEAERLTLAGAIVVRPEVIAYNRDRDQQFVEPEVKAALDVLHLRKIDLSDEVVVVTVNNYVGESTRREIDYAERTGKPVTFREYAALRSEEPTE